VRSQFKRRHKKEIIIDRIFPAEKTITSHNKENKLSALGTITNKDFGRVMGEIMKELKGTADGSLVKSLLSKKLGTK